MASPFLPPETLDDIISHIPPDEKDTLQSCTLGSRTLCALARPYLFHDIYVDVAERNRELSSFLHFLSANPHLARHIRDLRICDSEVDEIENEGRHVSPVTLRFLLRQLPRLQSLDLAMIIIAGGEPDAGSFAVTSTKLHYLRLDCAFSSDEASVFAVLKLFSSVEEFEVGTLPAPTSISIVTLATLHQFQAYASPPAIRSTLLPLSVKHIRMHRGPNPQPGGIMVLLKTIQLSPTMQTLSSIVIRIDQYVVAAELGLVLGVCGTRIKYCELDFRIPYHDKMSGEPRYAASVWQKLNLARCESLQMLTICGQVKYRSPTPSAQAPLRLFLDILSNTHLTRLKTLECVLALQGWRNKFDEILVTLFENRRYRMDWGRLRDILERCAALEMLRFNLQFGDKDPALAREVKAALTETVKEELPDLYHNDKVRVCRLRVKSQCEWW